ncbi:MAG: LppM family (lipo)protein [Acidimicrobiia bacterium]
MKPPLRVLTLVACALLLGACEVRSYLDIDMSDISTGAVSVQVGFDEEFREAMENFGGGTDLVGELEADAPGEGWEIERFSDGDIEGVTLTKEFSSLEELQQLVEEGRVSGPQEGLVGEVSFTDDGSTVRFEADVPQTGGDFEGFNSEELAGLLTYDARIRITFPGEVIDHNGVLEENTVTWSFDDPTAMGGTRLFAEARLGGGFPWVGLIGVLLGLGVIGLVAWRVLSSRRRPPEGLVANRLEHPVEDSAPEPAPVQPNVESE